MPAFTDPVPVTGQVTEVNGHVPENAIANVVFGVGAVKVTDWVAVVTATQAVPPF